ncbi:MAG: acetolactate synthase large subunit [Bryobacterales bacterium]|nr:acetolactate synthase large subunit [Bryobacterales bacterium]
MTGAESLLRTLLAGGVDTCFMNPGTSEMHFIAALDRVPGLRSVLCLFEGVCSGAADGYARATGRPAATLLHLGPGLANGLSNFHNARKARSPVVCIVGEHATPHLKVEAPLTSDIQAFARTVSNHVRTAQSADDIGPATAETIAAAWGPPGEVATLIVPADYSWSKTEILGQSIAPLAVPFPCNQALDAAARLLREPGTAILLGGKSVNERALKAAGRISAATGTRIITARNVAKIASGRAFYPAPQVPYFPEAALPFLADIQNLILVEAERPVSFFAYPSTPSYMTSDSCRDFVLAARGEDGTAALEALAEGLPPVVLPSIAIPKAPMEDVGLTLDHIGLTLAALLPENSLVSDEMVSSAGKILDHLKSAAGHEFMPVTGGSIGQGLPVATGAAIGCPGRKVVALEGDGSGMYTPQSLWTMARENLNVVTVILVNRRYRILEIEMQRTGAHGFGEKAESMLDIGNPDLNWTGIARSLSVSATCATTARQFSSHFRDAIRQTGPSLIEALLE